MKQPTITIGQELEFILLWDKRAGDNLENIPYLMQEQDSQIHAGKLYWYDAPHVYVDNGGEIEIVSSVHQSITTLYNEMSRLTKILEEVCNEKGFKINSSAHKLRGKNFCNAANQVSIVCSNWEKKCFHHAKKDDLDLNDLHAALCAYVPLFVALTNNSPNRRRPFTSTRLVEGRYSNIYFSDNAYNRPIRFNSNAGVLEVRAMDKAKTVEEDLAAAAIVLATVKYLHSVDLKRDLFVDTNASLEEKANIHAKKMYGGLVRGSKYRTSLQAAFNLSARFGFPPFQAYLSDLFKKITPFFDELPKNVEAEVENMYDKVLYAN